MRDAPPEDFSDQDAVRAWLRTQPPEVSVALAARTALRVVPVLARLDWEGRPDVSAALISAVFRTAAAALFATRGVNEEAAKAALSAADAAVSASSAVRAAAFSASSAGRAAAFAAPSAADAAAFSADAAAFSAAAFSAPFSAAFSASSAVVSASSAVVSAAGAISAARSDAAALAGRDPAAIRAACSRPLWPDGTPNWPRDAWARLKAALPPGEDWDVWTEWYEARLRGDPYDLDLESARVLEPTEEDWKDPKRANAKLREIVERRRRETHAAMLDRIVALEARLRALDGDTPSHGAADERRAPGIGHNRPPTEIEAPEAFLRPAIDALAQQPAEPADPAPAVQAARQLRNWLAAFSEWTGGKADTFFDAFATEAGRQAGGWTVRLATLGVAGWMLDIASRVAELYEAAVIWLRANGAPL